MAVAAAANDNVCDDDVCDNDMCDDNVGVDGGDGQQRGRRWLGLRPADYVET